MFECGDALRTWRLLKEPRPDSSMPAEPLGDHRTAYLDYEGPVSGDRGIVSRFEQGDYSGDVNTAADRPLRLNGANWVVDAVLETGETGQCWRFQAVTE